MTQINRKDLKRQAREAMGLTRPRFWVVCLIYLLLTTGVESLIRQLSSYQGPVLEQFSFFVFFCTILYNLYYLVVRFGYNLWSLWTWRRLNPGAGSLIQGFSIPGRVIIMELLIFLRIFLWVFLLAMALTLLVLAIPSPALYVLGFALVYVAVLTATLRDAMAPCLLADHPDDGAGAAVRRSVEMMQGKKWELFKLQFSFIGWYLLEFVLSGSVLLVFLLQSGAFSSAVTPDSLLFYRAVINTVPAFVLSNLITVPLSLWLTPYTLVAQAGFYDTLCRQGSGYEQMPPL